MLGLCLWCQHPKGVPVWIPVALLLIQHPANDLGCSRGGVKCLGPCVHVGRPGTNSWFLVWTGPAPAIGGHWGMNQCMEDISFCVSLCSFAFQIKEIIKKKIEERRRLSIVLGISGIIKHKFGFVYIWRN